MSDDQDIRYLGKQVREYLGLSEPPIHVEEALDAYQLTLPSDSLENVLAQAGLSPDVIQKLDAMLDSGERCVFVREDMHDRKKNWGYLHELAHHVIPWHHDLLYHCAILRLPPRLQKQFEREADQFATEVFFFGPSFVQEAMELPFGLDAPKQLATTRYDVSLHAAFMRYAEDNPKTCCLLVSAPVKNEDTGLFDLQLKYYAKSKGFPGHIPPRQVLPSGSKLGQLFNSGTLAAVVEHEFRVGGHSPKLYRANSFTNGYDIFTLIWDPSAEPPGA